MKKILLIFFLSLLFIQGIFAVEIDINENYSQGETLVAKISGNFLTSVGKNNIFFYNEHVRIPVEYDLVKIGSDYYVYAILVGKSEGNYSLSVENVKYMSGGFTNESDIVQNFFITNETAEFSVNPGFAISSGNFSISIQNLKDNSIIVNARTNDSSARKIYVSSNGIYDAFFTLNSGEVKKINFISDKGEETFQNIIFSSENLTYKIPIYISGANQSSETSSNKKLDFQNSDLIFSIPVNSIHKEKIYLYNKGNSSLENISISFSDSLSYFAVLSQDNIETLDADSNISLELSFFSEEEKDIQGHLYADTENESVSLFVSISFLKNSTSSDGVSVKTCAELNATICDTQTKKCNVNLISGKDGWCCPGVCSDIGASSSGKIIAIILIILMIIGLTWFYFKKYKKSKKPVDLIKESKIKNFR